MGLVEQALLVVRRIECWKQRVNVRMYRMQQGTNQRRGPHPAPSGYGNE